MRQRLQLQKCTLDAGGSGPNFGRNVPITTSSGLAAALSFAPPTAITNTAALLNRAQIGSGQVVMFHRVFACGLQTMLRDGSTHLIALTGCWAILCVALDR